MLEWGAPASEPISGQVLAARRRRAEHACRLLADPDRPLAQVALECGFADQSHLTAVFKRFIGTTPAEFRSTLV